jgi:hypothetical protein
MVNKIGGETCRIKCPVFVNLEIVSIVPVQSIPGTKPHKAKLVFGDSIDLVLRHTVFYAQMIKCIYLGIRAVIQEKEQYDNYSAMNHRIKNMKYYGWHHHP